MQDILDDSFLLGYSHIPDVGCKQLSASTCDLNDNHTYMVHNHADGPVGHIYLHSSCQMPKHLLDICSIYRRLTSDFAICLISMTTNANLLIVACIDAISNGHWPSIMLICKCTPAQLIREHAVQPPTTTSMKYTFLNQDLAGS
jgi:hypothetical protein